ncbi:Arf-GAP with dual PH domain-containing protein 1 [Balamuthia mandrillaris]
MKKGKDGGSSANESDPAAAKERKKKTAIIQQLLSSKGNDCCAECGKLEVPQWASATVGVFLCVSCAHVHRLLDRDISEPKPLFLENWKLWTEEELRQLEKFGNETAKKFWECRLPPYTIAPTTQDSPAMIEQWVRAKYERRAYCKNSPERNIRPYSEPSIEIPNIKSFLVKRGEVVKNWKLRWCSLHGSCLLYFKKMNPEAEPSGFILMKDVTNVEALDPGSSKFAFSVDPKISPRSSPSSASSSSSSSSPSPSPSPRKSSFSLSSSGKEGGFPPFSFVVATENRDYIFTAESGQLMYEWVMELRRSRARLCMSPGMGTLKAKDFAMEVMLETLQNRTDALLLLERKVGGKVWENTFVGANAVDVLVSELRLCSRTEGVLVGQRLMVQGFFKALDNKVASFQDDFILYRLDVFGGTTSSFRQD